MLVRNKILGIGILILIYSNKISADTGFFNYERPKISMETVEFFLDTSKNINIETERLKASIKELDKEDINKEKYNKELEIESNKNYLKNFNYEMTKYGANNKECILSETDDNYLKIENKKFSSGFNAFCGFITFDKKYIEDFKYGNKIIFDIEIKSDIELLSTIQLNTELKGDYITENRSSIIYKIKTGQNKYKLEYVFKEVEEGVYESGINSFWFNLIVPENKNVEIKIKGIYKEKAVT